MKQAVIQETIRALEVGGSFEEAGKILKMSGQGVYSRARRSKPIRNCVSSLILMNKFTMKSTRKGPWKDHVMAARLKNKIPATPVQETMRLSDPARSEKEDSYYVVINTKTMSVEKTKTEQEAEKKATDQAAAYPGALIVIALAVSEVHFPCEPKAEIKKFI